MKVGGQGRNPVPLQSLKQSGHSHASTDAEGDETVAGFSAPQFVQDRRRKAGAGAAEWMAESDGAAVDVQPSLIDRQLRETGEHLDGGKPRSARRDRCGRAGCPCAE